MPATVTFTVTAGDLPQPQYVFAERTTCIVGRERDCDPHVPDDKEHQSISRLHCLLDINPPDVRVRDFGSKFGTYVNGAKIGQRDAEEQRGRPLFPEHDLKDGDELRLGCPEKGKPVVFRVEVAVPARCGRCGAEVAAGVALCPVCERVVETAPCPAPPRWAIKLCARCGRDVAAEVGPLRHGEYVCGSCRQDPLQLARHLLEFASRAGPQWPAVEGYAIERELGQGGMGAVYLARHASTGARVALKVMLPRVAVSPADKDRFLREIDSTKALRHPHIVQLYDAAIAQGVSYFTMEYCDGGSLDQLLEERGGRLPVGEAVALTRQMLDGLEYAHNVFGPGDGLVHRDLKPGNLFLAGSGAARLLKVGDYGLAKSFDLAGLSGRTWTGEVAGTPHFMPRQQVVNFKYARPEVDVWAAAATLYFLLTGRTPRDFPAEKDPWQVVLQSGAVGVRLRNTRVPPKLADVLDEALIDKPEIRFKTVAAFRRALEAAC